MKYIKKLNIDFNNWEELNNNNYILDKFFHQTKYNGCYSYKSFYINSLLINENSINDIENYLYNNELKFNWESGNELIYGIKKYLKNNKEIVLVLRKNKKIFRTSFNNKCYIEIDFRK